MVVRVASFAAVALAVVACGGGGDAAPSDGSAPTDSTAATGASAETSAPADEVHTGDAHAGSATVTVSKQQFDELRLQVLELAVEVDKLQTAAGLTSAGDEPGEPGAATGEHAVDEAPHWTYEDAERWGELADEFGACGAGDEQSPIDLTGAVGLDIPNAVIDYVPGDATIIDNGHTVQVNVPEAGTLELDGKIYAFAEFHFHAPSEHTVEGDHWPMEWHFVHRAADGSLAVLGVLVEEGAPWPAFDVIVESLPMQRDVADIVYGDVDVADFLPDLTAAFRYDGSLTTPPCSEGVSWSVLQGTITMSLEQMEAFTSRLDEPNNRPVQPTNERTLEKDLSA